MKTRDPLSVVLLSAGSVGKSALIHRFLHDEFLNVWDPTIEDTYKRQLSVNDELVLLNILDSNGHAEYQSMMSSWVLRSEAVMAVYSVSGRASFEHVSRMHEKIIATPGLKYRLPGILVGNMCDCVDNERQVSELEGRALAERLGWGFIETSALTGHHVEEAFKMLVEEIIHSVDSVVHQHKQALGKLSRWTHFTRWQTLSRQLKAMEHKQSVRDLSLRLRARHGDVGKKRQVVVSPCTMMEDFSSLLQLVQMPRDVWVEQDVVLPTLFNPSPSSPIETAAHGDEQALSRDDEDSDDGDETDENSDGSGDDNDDLYGSFLPSPAAATAGPSAISSEPPLHPLPSLPVLMLPPQSSQRPASVSGFSMTSLDEPEFQQQLFESSAVPRQSSTTPTEASWRAQKDKPVPNAAGTAAAIAGVCDLLEPDLDIFVGSDRTVFKVHYIVMAARCAALIKQAQHVGDRKQFKWRLLLHPRSISAAVLRLVIVYAYTSAVEAHDVDMLEQLNRAAQVFGLHDLRRASELAHSVLLNQHQVVSMRTNSEKFTSDVRSLFRAGRCTDTLLLVDGRAFKAHSLVLVLRSSYFQTLFKWRALARHFENDPIVLDGVSHGDFKRILEFIYTGQVESLNADIAGSLVVAAGMFGLERLVELCEAKLQHLVDLTGGAISLLGDAEQFGAHQLTELCIQLLAENFQDVHRQPAFLALAEHLRRRVLIAYRFQCEPSFSV